MPHTVPLDSTPRTIHTRVNGITPANQERLPENDSWAFCLALSGCASLHFWLTSVIAAADMLVMDWKSVGIILYTDIFMIWCARVFTSNKDTVGQTIHYHIYIKTDSACGDGSLILLFVLVLTLCQAQQGNMAGGGCIHGYGLETAERLDGLGAGEEELSWQGSWQFRSLNRGSSARRRQCT